MLKRHVYSTKEALFEFISSELERYAAMPHVQHICLSGGSTPKGLFQYIVESDYRTQIKWKNLHFWWGDERCVRSSSPESNYGEAKRLLFDHIDIPQDQIHPVIPDAATASTGQDDSSAPLAEADCEQYLADFIAELQHMLEANSPIHDALAYPKFDWILLGIGEDGHTASLFPGACDLDERASALLVTKPGTEEPRITLSARCISASRRVSYLATGKGKARVLADIFGHAPAAEAYPAALIRSISGETDYYLDQDAAELLIRCK